MLTQRADVASIVLALVRLARTASLPRHPIIHGPGDIDSLVATEPANVQVRSDPQRNPTSASHSQYVRAAPLVRVIVSV